MQQQGKKGKSATVNSTVPSVMATSGVSQVFGGIVRSLLHRVAQQDSVTMQPFFTGG